MSEDEPDGRAPDVPKMRRTDEEGGDAHKEDGGRRRLRMMRTDTECARGVLVPDASQEKEENVRTDASEDRAPNEDKCSGGWAGWRTDAPGDPSEDGRGREWMHNRTDALEDGSVTG